MSVSSLLRFAGDVVREGGGSLRHASCVLSKREDLAGMTSAPEHE